VTSFFTTEQLADLMQINGICQTMGADLVVIGAAAIMVQLGDLGRLTRDIDLTVALDLDDFRSLSIVLESAGWQRNAKQEHRWITQTGTIIDLLPAGPRLRAAGKIIWPESEFEMSLAGFEHVFQGSVLTQLGPGAALRVASLPAVMLLKIVAYMDSPYRRAKDLQDIRLMLRRYLHDSDELLSDPVFDAELPDFSLANAFLLGRDAGRLVGSRDTPVIERFLDRVLAHQDLAAASGADLPSQLEAFTEGLRA
jgi:predicted nucleotidyltransferase